MKKFSWIFLSSCFLAVLSACAPQQRMGMVVDPETGLQFGSIVENNLVLDASQFENRKLKLNIRNVSGDPSFNLSAFREALENSYEMKGYEIFQEGEYGLLVDVNVIYSGQASRSLTREYAFLAGAAGGIAGIRSSAEGGTAIGVLSGATLGGLLGSYVSEDTYIIVAQVALRVPDPSRGKSETTITFGAGKKEKRKKKEGLKAFSKGVDTGIAVFAGGTNAPQSRIAGDVRGRLIRILKDII